MRLKSNHTKRGDTIIEVVVAITVFCLISIISITLMNSGINTAEGSLELTMVRNEMDAQAEALRFIHNSFLAERELRADQQQYTALWRRITRGYNECEDSFGDLVGPNCGLAINPEQLASFDVTTCQDAYGNESEFISKNNAFVINTRLIEPAGSNFSYEDYFGPDYHSDNYASLMDDIIVSTRDRPDSFQPATLYPRLIFSYHGGNEDTDSDSFVEGDIENEGAADTRLYRMVARAEGIWVTAVRGISETTASVERQEPGFFDFYIRSCWYKPGQDFPTTVGTIVRLYNPEVVE